MRIGNVIGGKWRLDALLGRGMTSDVYAVTHRNGHRAALKLFHASRCPDAEACTQILREARVANTIRHRSVVRIEDDGVTEDGRAYLVVELLEGETLEARRERYGGRLPLSELSPILEELTSAMAALHAADVVHRDLKPHDVFLTDSGQLRLLDFGTSRVFPCAPAFMSPEVAEERTSDVDRRSDVWSLGALLFAALSGESVHQAADLAALRRTAATKPARPLASVDDTIDDRIAGVVDRALAFEKTDRWQTISEMRLAFRRAVYAAMPDMPGARGDDEVTANFKASLRAFALPPPSRPRPVAGGAGADRAGSIVTADGISRPTRTEGEQAD